MAKQPSTDAGQARFASVPGPQIQRSSFDRSHGSKTTFDAGYLVPILVDEALPGDTFSLRSQMFGRLSTPLHPTMDNMYLDTFYFAVPMRLLWDNWQKFMGEQDNPGDSIDFTIPTQTSPVDGYDNGELHDQMGIPPEIEGIEHSALMLRAYNLIWNEWFRDQNLQDSVVVDKDDGPDDPSDYILLRRGKRHDYFSSCLPWPQKGDPVEIPIGATAPVSISGIGTDPIVLQNSGGTEAMQYVNTIGFAPNSPMGNAEDVYWNSPGLEGVADLSSATATTINELREGFQIQRMLERDARGGTRYTELIRAHFGVVSPDQRLQRPEFLGGSSQNMSINQVEATTTRVGENLGDLGAFAAVVGSAGTWRKSFTEHTIIIGLISFRADLNYQQGLDRMWSRSTKYDFYWPALAQLGEQAVLNKEIYAQGVGDPTADEAVFGYQERYAEYRFKPSQVKAAFRSSYATTLDAWHLAQNFSVLPVLDATFIEENPPIARILAVGDPEPNIIMDSYFKLICARPMPVYSVPGLIDHF